MFGGKSNNNKNQSTTTDITIPQGSNVSPNEYIETTVGRTVSLQGVLKAEGSIRIDGVFEGEIETVANVIIGREAKVLANIKARNVLVAGRVKGNITAYERLEIVSTGGVLGDIDVGHIFIEEGGFFQGQSLMKAEEPENFLLESPR
jgi:cytoskeletal protein CcmA (bactofilin family)